MEVSPYNPRVAFHLLTLDTEGESAGLCKSGRNRAESYIVNILNEDVVSSLLRVGNVERTAICDNLSRVGENGLVCGSNLSNVQQRALGITAIDKCLRGLVLLISIVAFLLSGGAIECLNGDGVFTLRHICEFAVDVERRSIPDLSGAVVGLEVASSGLILPDAARVTSLRGGVRNSHLLIEACDVKRLSHLLARSNSLFEDCLHSLLDCTRQSGNSLVDLLGCIFTVLVSATVGLFEILESVKQVCKICIASILLDGICQLTLDEVAEGDVSSTACAGLAHDVVQNGHSCYIGIVVLAAGVYKSKSSTEGFLNLSLQGSLELAVVECGKRLSAANCALQGDKAGLDFGDAAELQQELVNPEVRHGAGTCICSLITDRDNTGSLLLKGEADGLFLPFTNGERSGLCKIFVTIC